MKISLGPFALSLHSVLFLLAFLACRPVFGFDKCEALARLSTPSMKIGTALVVRTGVFNPPAGKRLDSLPAFCRVAATLHPSFDSAIRIELWMPEAGWNGRLEGTGNGGFAGNISYGSLAEGVRHGYAVVNTDMGMATLPGQDASVFIDRPERWKDWGYRSTHEMTVQAKRFVDAYYARPATHSYFVGCSTGGEQGWMEAQRFPDDYDGIVSGAPANNRTGVHESILWNFVVTQRTPEDRIPAAKLPVLAKAVTDACDRLDGVSDGIISEPSKCAFDPAVLKCSGSDNEHCLTARQVQTVRRLYDGPVDSFSGKRIYAGLPKGSELGWDHLAVGAKGQPPYAPIFNWVFGRDWDWRSFDFHTSVSAVDAKLKEDLNATSLDLHAFREHGHKLLVYHGWSDWLVVPGESVRYRDALASRYTVPGLDQFYRLYMVPGMNHCGGGVGPDHFEAREAVVDWVEKGRAPDKLIASQLSIGQDGGVPSRTRPLCPYPQVARYVGRGSIDEQSHFACVVSNR